MIKSQNKINISGWGGYPVQKAKVLYPEKVEQIITEIKKGDLIARGNGRAYGDSSINEKKTINMKCLKTKERHYLTLSLQLHPAVLKERKMVYHLAH